MLMGKKTCMHTINNIAQSISFKPFYLQSLNKHSLFDMAVIWVVTQYFSLGVVSHNLSPQEKVTQSFSPGEGHTIILPKRRSHNPSTQEKVTQSISPGEGHTIFLPRRRSHNLSPREKHCLVAQTE